MLATVSVGRRHVTLGFGLVSLLALGLGVVYLVVACQSLPGFLGQGAGDPHPRTPLGAALLVFAALLAAAVAIVQSPPGRSREKWVSRAWGAGADQHLASPRLRGHTR
jgi:hypothetical protein